MPRPQAPAIPIPARPGNHQRAGDGEHPRTISDGGGGQHRRHQQPGTRRRPSPGRGPDRQSRRPRPSTPGPRPRHRPAPCPTSDQPAPPTAPQARTGPMGWPRPQAPATAQARRIAPSTRTTRVPNRSASTRTGGPADRPTRAPPARPEATTKDRHHGHVAPHHSPTRHQANGRPHRTRRPPDMTTIGTRFQPCQHAPVSSRNTRWSRGRPRDPSGPRYGPRPGHRRRQTGHDRLGYFPSQGVQERHAPETIDHHEHEKRAPTGSHLRKPSTGRDGGIRTHDPLLPTVTVSQLLAVVKYGHWPALAATLGGRVLSLIVVRGGGFSGGKRGRFMAYAVMRLRRRGGRGTRRWLGG